MLLKIFSNNVKSYRIQKGYSQEKLAEISGLHRTYIGGIESNVGRNVSLNNIEKIAKALGISPEKLLMEEHKNGK